MGRMEGQGDGKVERNLQTRRERESESLFSLGWPRYGRCPAQELKCLRGPRSSLPAGAGTHLDHLRSAGAERSALRNCRCGTLGLLKSGAWPGVVPALSRGSARPRPGGGALGARAEYCFWAAGLEAEPAFSSSSPWSTDLPLLLPNAFICSFMQRPSWPPS